MQAVQPDQGLTGVVPGVTVISTSAGRRDDGWVHNSGTGVVKMCVSYDTVCPWSTNGLWQVP